MRAGLTSAGTALRTALAAVQAGREGDVRIGAAVARTGRRAECPEISVRKTQSAATFRVARPGICAVTGLAI